jgi:hypothetical protein
MSGELSSKIIKFGFFTGVSYFVLSNLKVRSGKYWYAKALMVLLITFIVLDMYFPTVRVENTVDQT